jgi:plastocyanin
MRATFTALVAVLAVIALAGCGNQTADRMHGSDGGRHPGRGVDGRHPGHGDDGRHHATGSPVAPGARQIVVEAADLRFTPDAIELVAGQDVAVELTALDIEHDFVIDEVDFHVGARAGQTAIAGLRIDEPGIYSAYCSVRGHRAAGMEATVTVTE